MIRVAMQFHKHGYRPGDPAIADDVAALPPAVEDRPLPAEVDVLIVGSGPTGLTLAAQLAAMPDLGWKLAAVAQGRADPALLDTYAFERHAVAKQLIEFDREFAAMMSSRPDDPDGATPAEVASYFQQAGRYTAGVATRYLPSIVTAEAPAQELARGFVVGMRFHSAPVMRVADGKRVELGQVARADGRWRLYAFADSAPPTGPDSRLWALCEFLQLHDRSPLVKYTPRGVGIDAVFDVRGIIQQPHHQVEIFDLPELLRPRGGQLSLVDYEKVFSGARADGTDIYRDRGIDRSQGALIVVRPDQHVAHVLALDAFDELAGFFDTFMR